MECVCVNECADTDTDTQTHTDTHTHRHTCCTLPCIAFLVTTEHGSSEFVKFYEAMGNKVCCAACSRT